MLASVRNLINVPVPIVVLAGVYWLTGPHSVPAASYAPLGMQSFPPRTQGTANYPPNQNYPLPVGARSGTGQNPAVQSRGGSGPQDDLSWGQWVQQQRQRAGNDAISDRFDRPMTADMQLGVAPASNPGGNPNAPNLPPREFVEASRIIARVGQYTIFAGDIIPEINELIEKNMGQASESMKEMQRQQALKLLTPKAVEQKLMLVAATQELPEKTKLDDVLKSVQESFIETELPKLLEQYKVENAHELNAVLNSYGGSLRQRQRQWAESQFIGFMMRQKIDIDPEVTHQELLDYYYEHLDEYEIPAKARWQELMVRFSQFPSREAAKNAVARMGDEVVFGAPFEAVAKRHSQGFTAEEGGFHDWTSKGALKGKKLDQALFELPINYLSDIIESEMGYHIVRVLERQDADHVSFREAQLEIRKKLKKAKQSESLMQYMEEVKRTVPVWTFMDDEPEGQ